MPLKVQDWANTENVPWEWAKSFHLAFLPLLSLEQKGVVFEEMKVISLPLLCLF